MQEVSSDHDGVLTGVDGVNPSRGDEQRLSGRQLGAVASVRHHVGKENLALVVEFVPALKVGHVAGRGAEQVELFGAAHHVIPDGAAAKVDVEVRVGVGHAENAILLDLGRGIRGKRRLPQRLDPAQLADEVWCGDPFV